MSTNENPSPGILGRWYAEPMDSATAKACLEQAELRLRNNLRRGRRSLTPRFAMVIAKFWLGREIEAELESLRYLTRKSAHGRILCDLIQGQLMMGRQLKGAMHYLERAFMTSRALYAPSDYFQVMKRHQLLAELPLSEHPTPPRTLQELVTAAAVIQEFGKRGNKRKPYTFDPRDTYG